MFVKIFIWKKMDNWERWWSFHRFTAYALSTNSDSSHKYTFKFNFMWKENDFKCFNRCCIICI